MKKHHHWLVASSLLGTALVSVATLFHPLPRSRTDTPPADAAASAPANKATAAKHKTAQERENERLFFGHDERQKVDVQAAPWRWVVQWETDSGTECSGALVAPDIVVSAAHCLLLERNIAFDHPQVVHIGYAGGQSLYTRQVVSAWISPAFRRGLSYRRDGLYIQPTVAPLDVSFLKLNVPLPAKFGHFAIATGNRHDYNAILANLNNHVTQSGYPGDDDSHQHAHIGCTVTHLNPNNTLSHRCDTLEGDSGSPIFATIQGVPTLLGVQSSAPPAEQRDLDDNVAVAVPAWREMYDRWLSHVGKP